MKKPKCCGKQMRISPNDSRTRTLPFTIRCKVCRRWWDISKDKAIDYGYIIPTNLRVFIYD